MGTEFEIFLLTGFALMGTTLLACFAKGDVRLFRYNLMASGAAIAVTALAMYGVAATQSLGWAIISLYIFVPACAVSALFTLYTLLNCKKDSRMSLRLRACCLGLAVMCFTGFILVHERTTIATSLQCRAIAAGRTSSLAKRIAWELQYWDALVQLEPSPQKEQLIQMIRPSVWPPEGFWQTLLSLPPSPGRLAVIASYAHDLQHANVKWLAVLYDQHDTEALDIAFEENKQAYCEYSLQYIVGLQRMDILRDVFRRGGEAIRQEIHKQEEKLSHDIADAMLAAIQTGNPEIVAFFLDNGVSPTATIGDEPLLYWAKRYSRTDVISLLQERIASTNQHRAAAKTVPR